MSGKLDKLIESFGELRQDVALLKQMQESQGQTLDKVLAQTTATNGRVTSLEQSRSYSKGAAWALGMVIGGFIGLLAWMGVTMTDEVHENTTFRLQNQHQTQQVK